MNLLEYLEKEFAPFSEQPFNPVDSAALSQFCMVRVEGIVPPLREPGRFGRLEAWGRRVAGSHKPLHFRDLLRAELYDRMFTGLVPGHVKECLYALAASPRFRDARICNAVDVFDEQQQTQFGAVTVLVSPDVAYVGFRGTDASITGWREDFNMACTAPVPAQLQAARYLTTVAAQLPRTCRIIVGGHSKGANLAAYAALKADTRTQQRIERVYSHDGPGFKDGLFTAADWDALSGRIHRTVPQESIVGMLMHMPVTPHVVKSAGHGIDQHSVFRWEVDGRDFAYADALADSAQLTNDVLDEWLGRMSDDEATAVVNALFRAIELSGAKDATDIFFSGPATVSYIAEAAKRLEGDDRTTLLAALGSLAELIARHVGKNVADSLPKWGKR